MKSIAGKFLVFEGIGGSGKTYAMRHVVEWLQRNSSEAVVATKEPTENAFGLALRHAWQEGIELSPRTEHDLFILDRADHSEEIKNSLRIGACVVSDRYYHSYVYQLAAGIPLKMVRRANAGFVEPHLVLLFSLDPAIAYKRIVDRGTNTRPVDMPTLINTQWNYIQEFKDRPNVVIIDAAQHKNAVVDDCLIAISERLLDD